MDWLWKGIEGPRYIPDWAYRHLVNNLKVEPDLLTSLDCVEQTSFLGTTLVQLIRIFDRRNVPEGINIHNFISLDRHPELILYEGHLEKDSGKVYITAEGQVLSLTDQLSVL